MIFKLPWCREAGVLVRNLDITSGEVRVNLNEDFLLKEKSLSESSPDPSPESVQENKESGSGMEKLQGKQALSVSKYTTLVPEKVGLISTALTLVFLLVIFFPIIVM